MPERVKHETCIKISAIALEWYDGQWAFPHGNVFDFWLSGKKKSSKLKLDVKLERLAEIWAEIAGNCVESNKLLYMRYIEKQERERLEEAKAREVGDLILFLESPEAIMRRLS